MLNRRTSAFFVWPSLRRGLDVELPESQGSGPCLPVKQWTQPATILKTLGWRNYRRRVQDTQRNTLCWRPCSNQEPPVHAGTQEMDSLQPFVQAELRAPLATRHSPSVRRSHVRVLRSRPLLGVRGRGEDVPGPRELSEPRMAEEGFWLDFTWHSFGLGP